MNRALIAVLVAALLSALPVAVSANEPTPTATPEAAVCLSDGGTQACGPLVPCEFYTTVFVRNEITGAVEEVTVDGIWLVGSMTLADCPNYVPEEAVIPPLVVEQPEPQPVAEPVEPVFTPVEQEPVVLLPDTAMGQ